MDNEDKKPEAELLVPELEKNEDGNFIVPLLKEGFFVVIKPFVNRKQNRTFRKDLFADASVDNEGKRQIDFQNVDKGTERLLLSMVVSANEDGKEVEKTNQEWLDEMNEIDYKKLDSIMGELMGDHQKKA